MLRRRARDPARAEATLEVVAHARDSYTGNEPARIGWAFARTAGQPAWTGLPGITSTSGGSSSTVNLGYTPSSDPPNTATLTTSRNGGGKICNIPRRSRS